MSIILRNQVVFTETKFNEENGLQFVKTKYKYKIIWWLLCLKFSLTPGARERPLLWGREFELFVLNSIRYVMLIGQC